MYFSTAAINQLGHFDTNSNGTNHNTKANAKIDTIYNLQCIKYLLYKECNSKCNITLNIIRMIMFYIISQVVKLVEVNFDGASVIMSVASWLRKPSDGSLFAVTSWPLCMPVHLFFAYVKCRSEQWRNRRGTGAECPQRLLIGKFLLTHREKRSKGKMEKGVKWRRK